MPDDAQRTEGPHAPVVLRSVSRRWGLVQVLHEIDLDLGRGEVVALLGPEGAGKTTLCRVVAGSERIDTGSVGIEGRALRRRRGLRRQRTDGRTGIGLVTGGPELLAHRTALQNVVFGRGMFGLLGGLGAEQERRGLALLDRVGAAGSASRFPEELSAPLRQRVAVARALAAEPGVLLLDDPAADPAAGTPGAPRRALPAVLRGLAADGLAVLVATDTPALARAAADRVVFLDGGRIIEQGAPEDFFAMPRTARARDFLAGAPPR